METTSALLIPLLLFSASAAFTPGPNNVMLTASGANYGFAPTVPHMFGVVVGFLALLFGVAFGLGVLFERYPSVQNLLKLAGCAYLFYFAWRIARSDRANTARTGRPFTLLQAASFQFINPKGWLVAISAMAAFTRTGGEYVQSAMVVIAVFALVTGLSVVTWTGFGTAIGRLLKTPRAFRVFNVVMAMLTAGSVALLFI